MSQLRWSRLFLAVFLGALAALAGWQLLARLYPVLLIILAGFGLAYLFDPLLHRLERRGFSRGQAVALLALVLLVLLGFVSFLVVPAVVNQIIQVANQWPGYAQRIQAWMETAFDDLTAWLQVHYPEAVLDEYLMQLQQEAASWLYRLPLVLRWLTGALMQSLKTLGVVLLTLIIGLYFMVVINRFRRAFAAMFPAREREDLRIIDREVSSMLGQYLRGMAITCLAVACVNSFLLFGISLRLGTEYFLLVGLLSGLAYLVPWLGITVTIAAAAAAGYLTADAQPWLALGLSVGAVVATNFCFDNLVMPRIVGRKVGLHPLVVIIALLCGVTLLGFWGVLLATPLAATLKIILAHWVPVVAPAPEKPLQRQPLTLDLEAFFGKAWATMRQAGQRIEDAFTPAGPARPAAPPAPPEEPDKDTPDDHS